MQDTIEKIRAFNRFYLPAMNLLGDHYLGSEYSITQARIFFEIHQQEGCNAAHIAQVMNIDKSYLSRILKQYENSGFIRRERSETDSRSYRLYLTASGNALAELFSRQADQEIRDIIHGLSPEEQHRLTEALATVTNLLRK